MISPEETGYTIQPLSRLSIMLAIIEAKKDGLNHWALGLVSLYNLLYPEDCK